MYELFWKLDNRINNVLVLTGIFVGDQTEDAFEVFWPEDVIVLLERILDYLYDLQNQSFRPILADLSIYLLLDSCWVVDTAHAINM